jgi:hypothetical protein
VSAATKPGAQIVTGELHRVQRGHRKGFSPEPPPEPERRPARVAVTLALAHTIQRAIDRGEIRDQADAARKLGLTRARLTQIMDLTRLAPDVQEGLLFTESPCDASTAVRALRAIAINQSWIGQREHVAHIRRDARLTPFSPPALH